MTRRPGPTPRYAEMFAALGAEPRLRIVRLLLRWHPTGLVVGDIAAKMDMPGSTLSHHLDKLKQERLVRVRREGTFLWYTADTGALEELLGFLYAECCSCSGTVRARKAARRKATGHARA